MPILKHLFLSQRFFFISTLCVGVLVSGYFWPFLFPIGQYLLFSVAFLFLVDVFILFSSKKPVDAQRFLPKLFSLGDENKVVVELQSLKALPLSFQLVDEIPHQFQDRHFGFAGNLGALEKRNIEYSLVPNQRGLYQFGNANLLISTFLNLAERRLILSEEQELPVYPSIVQLKKFELMAFAKLSVFDGIKKVRRIGHSYEFEQIKNYVPGDDIRSINWKATGRSGKLQVNQFEDEKSQQVYCIIDKSRSMKMPFDGLSLLDYAINTVLVISNIVLQKDDKAGLLSFSDKLGSLITADKRNTQLKRINEALYQEKEVRGESNYQLLYSAVHKTINQRSLLFLFSNFETEHALRRNLALIRKMNHLHLLVVVLFINTEVADALETEAKNTEEVYAHAVARDYINQKKKLASVLRKAGVQTILTKPQDLSLNTVNKYLELKARGLI